MKESEVWETKGRRASREAGGVCVCVWGGCLSLWGSYRRGKEVRCLSVCPAALAPALLAASKKTEKEKGEKKGRLRAERKKNTSAIKIKRLSGFATRPKLISLLCSQFVL